MTLYSALKGEDEMETWIRETSIGTLLCLAFAVIGAVILSQALPDYSALEWGLMMAGGTLGGFTLVGVWQNYHDYAEVR